MPDSRTAVEIIPITEGTQFTPTDYASLQKVIDNISNILIDALGGPNFNPAQNPVTITPGSGMAVTVGGTGQFLISQGLPLDTCASTSIAITAAGGSDRLDLIAVKANRTAGSTAITRNVRADNATPNLLPLSATLSGGTQTVNLPTGYASAPAVEGWAAVGPGPGIISFQTTTSTVTLTSTDATDSRVINFQVYGATTGVATASAGVPTAITLLESQPLWMYVQGSSTSQPATPSGYDAFATILIPASTTSISAGNITYLFPTIPALSLAMTLLQLTLGQAGTENNNGVFLGNASTEGSAGQLTRIAVNSGITVAGIIGSLLAIDDYLAGGKLTIKTNGDVGIAGNVHATEFFGSGAGLTAIPGSALAHGDYVDIANTQSSINGLKTFLANLTVVASIIAGAAGKATITDDGTNALLQSPGAVKLKSNTGGSAQTATLDTSGNLAVPANITSGGTISSTNVGDSIEITTSAAVAQIGDSGVNVVGTITGNLFAIAQKTVAWLLALDTAGNMGIAGDMHAAEFFGSGAGLTAIPNSALVDTPVDTITSTGGTVAITPSGSTVDIETTAVYTGTGSGTVQPTGKVWVGSAMSGAGGSVTLTLTGTVQGGVASVIDATLANAITIAVVSVSGNTITFNARFTNTQPPTAAVGAGFNYIVVTT